MSVAKIETGSVTRTVHFMKTRLTLDFYLQVAGRSVPPAETLPPPQYLPYHPRAHYHPLSSHTGHVDLPPNDGHSDYHKTNQR